MSSKEDKVHYTSPDHHRLMHFNFKQNHFPHCRHLHLLDQELGSIALDAPEGHNNLWAKTRQAFQYVYRHHKVGEIVCF